MQLELATPNALSSALKSASRVDANQGWNLTEYLQIFRKMEACGLEFIEQPLPVWEMDVQMPVMDGLEAIRQLRTDSRFAFTPIVALTALAMPGDRERCLEAGANEYMSKPASLKILLNTIKDLLAK